MKKIIYILLISTNAFAGKQLFEQANNLYANENYKEAILKYDSILDKGMSSAELYYNLGNCYYQQQDWANAIWNYEKSLTLKKHQKTIENLQIANSKIIDQIEPIPQLFYKKWWQYMLNLCNTKSWQLLTIISTWIFCLLTIFKTIFTNTKTLRHIMLFASLIFFTASYYTYSNNILKEHGIIISSSITVHSAPTKNSTNLFSLHAGTKAIITDEIGDWINIKLINGNDGWINKKHFKTL